MTGKRTFVVLLLVLLVFALFVTSTSLACKGIEGFGTTPTPTKAPTPKAFFDMHQDALVVNYDLAWR